MHSEGDGAFTLGRFLFTLSALVVLVGCGKDTALSIGQAYVAPETLNVRRELTQRNATVATLNHGDRVDIVDVRRRWVKVRTRAGQEGWVDAIQLLSQEQMDQIRREDRQYLTYPSEGSATVYEALNIHIEPSRQAPAFARISEGGSVTVLAHRLAPKSAEPYRAPTFERPQPVRHARKDRTAKLSFLPPPPAPPKPPDNWQQLSDGKVGGVESPTEEEQKTKELAPKKVAEAKKPVVIEDWSLVRTKDNQIGWVLTRNLEMSIPDEVAQYAEGKRISSYFDLGTVQDQEKGLKHNWLWTTSAELEPYDFDAWRVFLWNRRHHRFETSYRQRDLEGYFPVHVDPPDSNAFDRTFEIITKDDDGQMRRHRYSFDGTRVHLVATENYRREEPVESAAAGGIDTNKLQSKMPHENWFKRVWKSFRLRKSGA